MNKHEKILKNINPNLEIKERFTGGMSNFTYHVINPQTNHQFVFRIPGHGAQNFVNFVTERKNLAIIDELNINSRTIFTNPTEGIKISEYIPGQTVDKNIDLENVSTLLKRLHNSNLKLADDYNHLSRLQHYEAIHHQNNPLYFELKQEFVTIFNKYLVQHTIYPCHNDAQVANMIVDKDNNLSLLDWEFAGTNDFIYDIASFGNTDFTMAENLLTTYLSNPSDNDYIRLYGWRLFQCLQWYNVASYKEEIGLSKDLNIDFAAVSKNYLNLAKIMLSNINKHL